MDTSRFAMTAEEYLGIIYLDELYFKLQIIYGDFYSAYIFRVMGDEFLFDTSIIGNCQRPVFSLHCVYPNICTK